jgi:hypothetical protein
MCGKNNKRHNPTNTYSFVCHPPKKNFKDPRTDGTFPDDSYAEKMAEWDELFSQWESGLNASCYMRHDTGFQEGWYRSMEVYFPYCQSCGSLFTSRLPDQIYCDKTCGPLPVQYAQRLRHQAQQASPTLRRSEVFERDNWLCHICGKAIEKQPIGRMEGASIDHVIPIAAGGTHTLENVKASHLRCNIEKSDTVLSEDEFDYIRELRGQKFLE